jgi:hypothetical protein
MNYNNLHDEINAKYANSPSRKKLAEKCLEKAKEWLDNFSDENDISNLTNVDIKKMKRECTAYVKKNVDTGEERKIYGSVLLMIIMGAIVSWLVQRLLDELFD